MSIDVHAHYMPLSTLEASRTGADWFGTTFTPDSAGGTVIDTDGYVVRMGPVEAWRQPKDRVTEMDELDVDVQLLSLNPILFRYYLDRDNAVAAARTVNDEMRGAIDLAADRFGGFGIVPAQDPTAAVKELTRCMEELGFVGVAIGTHVDGANWDEERFLPFFEAADSLGALLFMHPSASRIAQAAPRYHMRNYFGNPLETTIAIGSLIFGGVIDRFPNLNLATAHGGGYSCWAIGRMDHGYSVRTEAREHIDRLPNEYLEKLYFDSLTHDHHNLRLLIDRVGADHVILGTDYPADMGQPDPVGWLRNAPLEYDELDKILDKNLRGLLGERAEGLRSGALARH